MRHLRQKSATEWRCILRNDSIRRNYLDFFHIDIEEVKNVLLIVMTYAVNILIIIEN